MTNTILSSYIASISDLKKNPMGTIEDSHGEAVAILNRNQPVFYCVPPQRYEALMDMIDNLELQEIIQKRMGEKEIAVNIDDL